MVTVKGDQQLAKQCLLAVVPGEKEPRLNIQWQVNMAELEEELDRIGRNPEEKSVEEVKEVRLDPADSERFFLLGGQLSEPERAELLYLLLQNKDVFTWTPYEMPGINPEVMSHRLNVDPEHKPVMQKARRSGIPQTEAVIEEVEKQLEAGAIREV